MLSWEGGLGEGSESMSLELLPCQHGNTSIGRLSTELFMRACNIIRFFFNIHSISNSWF